MAADSHLDATQLASYHAIGSSRPIQAIVTDPTLAVIDVALPLAVLAAEMLVCCRVPITYLTRAPAPRMAWLRRLHTAERLFLFPCPGPGSYSQHSLWLVILAAPMLRNLLLHPEAVTADSIPVADSPT